jgi:hypothetical protein
MAQLSAQNMNMAAIAKVAFTSEDRGPRIRSATSTPETWRALTDPACAANMAPVKYLRDRRRRPTEQIGQPQVKLLRQ